MTALTLNLDAIVQLTDDAFYTLCRANPEIQFERTAKGELIIMPPTGEKLKSQCQAHSSVRTLG
jgi:Uma2 family endonuclease